MTKRDWLADRGLAIRGSRGKFSRDALAAIKAEEERCQKENVPLPWESSDVVQVATYSFIRCGGCTSEWTGTGRCHCSACHLTFSGESTFSAHRKADAGRGKCKNPVEMGLVLNGRGIWCVPRETDEDSDESED